MKTTDVNIEILKNYGSTEINTVFSLSSELSKNSMNISHLLYHDIANAKTVYLCLEKGFSTELDTMLKDNKGGNFQAYILVKNIQPYVWDNCPYKDKLVIREIPDLLGNYIIIENDIECSFYIFDRNFNGYKCDDTSALLEMKQTFISEFWNHSQKEYVLGVGNAADKTFDVPLLKSGKTLIVNDGVEEKSTLEKELIAVTGLFVETNPEKYINSNLKEIYLKKIPEKDVLEAYLQNGICVFYCPTVDIHFCKKGETYFVSNIDLGSNLIKEKRDGRLFLLKSDLPSIMYGDVYRLNKTLTWNDCEGKKVLDYTGKPINIVRRGQDVIVSSRPIDARIIKKLRHDSSKWEPILDKQNLFSINEQAIETLFKITIPVMKKTFTNKADIYSQFEVANNNVRSIYDGCLNAIDNKEKDYIKRKEDKIKSHTKEEDVLRKMRIDLSRDEDSSENKIRGLQQEIKNIESSPEVLSYDKKINTWEGKIQESKNKLQVLLKDPKKADGSKEDIDKQISGYEKEIEKLKGDKNKKIAELSKNTQEKIDAEKTRIESYRDKELQKIGEQEKKVNDLEFSRDNITTELKNLKTVKDRIENNKKQFSEIKTLSSFDTELERLKLAVSGIYQRNIDIKRPDFELPAYGELYQNKQSFEYVVFDEDNLEKAEQEMSQYQISDVKFVVG